MSYNKIGEAFVSLFNFLIFLVIVFVPLGIWKAIELIIGWFE